VNLKTIALCSICFLFYAFKQTVRALPHRNVESGLNGLNRRLGEKTSLLLPENSSQIKPNHGKKVHIIVLSIERIKSTTYFILGNLDENGYRII
jgi:hypothetical protein